MGGHSGPHMQLPVHGPIALPAPVVNDAPVVAGLHPFPMGHVIEPFSDVLVAVGPQEGALAVHFAALETPLVAPHFPTVVGGPHHFAFAVGRTKAKGAHVSAGEVGAAVFGD